MAEIKGKIGKKKSNDTKSQAGRKPNKFRFDGNSTESWQGIRAMCGIVHGIEMNPEQEWPPEYIHFVNSFIHEYKKFLKFASRISMEAFKANLVRLLKTYWQEHLDGHLTAADLRAEIDRQIIFPYLNKSGKVLSPAHKEELVCLYEPKEIEGDPELKWGIRARAKHRLSRFLFRDVCPASLDKYEKKYLIPENQENFVESDPPAPTDLQLCGAVFTRIFNAPGDLAARWAIELNQLGCIQDDTELNFSQRFEDMIIQGRHLV